MHGRPQCVRTPLRARVRWSIVSLNLSQAARDSIKERGMGKGGKRESERARVVVAKVAVRAAVVTEAAG